MRRFLIVFAIPFFLAHDQSFALDANTLSAEETAAGWKLLFNGKTLDGWHVYGKAGQPITNWRVEQGTIALPKTNGRPGTGDLVTDLKFRDFDFRFEWRIGAGGNSGVHVLFDEQRPSTTVKMYAGDKGNAPIGLEYQLLDDERHPDAKNGPLRQTASIYALVPSVGRENKPVGEFNSSRILLQGRHIEHWLNGKKVAEAELDSEAFKSAVAKSKFKDFPNFVAMRETPLALQDHGEEVAFRNLKIRELSPAGANAKSPAEPSDGRFPVPNETKCNEIEAVVRDIFKSEFSRSAPKEKQTLARKLSEQGLDTHDDAATRYVLLRDSLSLSVQAGDVNEALRTSDNLVRLFAVDPVAVNRETLTQLAATVATESAPALARECVEFLDRLCASESFDVALAVIPVAQAAARRAKDVHLSAQIEAASARVRNIYDEFVKAQQAKLSLQGGGNAESAHLALGRYLCFYRNEWNNGVPHLAAGSDAALKDLALQEAAKPAETSAQLALSDGWLNLAKAEKTNASLIGVFNARAMYWCEKALGSATGGLLKLKAEKRLAQLKPKESGPAIPTVQGGKIDVLALIATDKDVVSGEWERKDGALTVGKSAAARVELPYRPPQEYDFKLVFTCEAAPAQVCQILSVDGHSFSWIMGASKGQYSGIEMIAGANVAGNPTTIKQKQTLEPGHRYTSVVEVRKDRVRVNLDGKWVTEWKTDYKDLSIVPSWQLRDENVLGIGSHNTATVIHSAEVTEVTGKGTMTR